MSVVKSFSVDNGDMFYIKHNSDSFTIIDCNLPSDNRGNEILNKIKDIRRQKGIYRFISTHPDEDHIHGLDVLCKKIEMQNFYCVKNEVAKSNITPAFCKYCELRDSSVTYYISKGVKRKWLNDKDKVRDGAGIAFYWPLIENPFFQKELEKIKQKDISPNNISPIITYSVEGSACFMWIGDLEVEFMENISNELIGKLPKVDVLFAPHHGRNSGKIPKKIINTILPRVIIVGEAPSKYLNYYCDYNTITQNSTGDITFYAEPGILDIYASRNCNYSRDFLFKRQDVNYSNRRGYYIGSIKINSHRAEYS